MVFSWHQLKLMNRCRVLRAQGLKVRVHGWLLVIEGGKPSSVPSLSPRLPKLSQASKGAPKRQTLARSSIFPSHPLF